MTAHATAGSIRAQRRAVRTAGMAAAALLAVLAARLGVVLGAEPQWLAAHYPPPRPPPR